MCVCVLNSTSVCVCVCVCVCVRVVLTTQCLYISSGFPEITYASPHTTLVMGQSVALSCNFTSIPTPTVKWTLNGSKVVSDGEQLSINTVDGSSVLTVTGLTYTTSGMYQCFVENKMGIVEKSISVSVLGGLI